MAGTFYGLMMGVSKQYWVDILKKIHATAGSGTFRWSDIQRQHPDINKSVLSRLKCSGYLIQEKHKRYKDGGVAWKLNPNAFRYINSPVVVKKRKRQNLK
jgi:hypothetical protein